MNVTDRIRTWVLRGMVKAASLRVQFMTPTFRALCQEGVRANGIVHNCLLRHAFAYPEPRLRVYREVDGGLEPLPNHPAQALLDRPNPQMSQAQLLQHIAIFKPIGGNCYLYKVRSKSHRPVELLPLNDSQIVPVAGSTLPIDHYNWLDEESGKEVPIPYEDIIHLKWMPDPLVPWRGLAPLVALAREIDTDNEARRYLFTLLKNHAIPPFVITAPPGSKPLSEDERKRVDMLWAEKYGGENRGKAAILGGFDVKTIGLNLQELAFEALSHVPEARIAGALGVPAVMAGLNVGLDNSTYNNFEGFRKVFTEGTLVPLWRMDADEISVGLLSEFGDAKGLVIAFDLSKVAALQENIKELRTWANDALRSGGITRNQYLGYLGLPPDPAGDVYLMSFTTQAVPVGQVPTPPTLPAPKALLPARTESKANADRRQIMHALIAAQRQNRADVAGRMESALNGYFGGLADRIINRANALAANEPKGARQGQSKGAVPWDELMFQEDDDELETLVKRFYVELLQLSWAGWNLELGTDVAFDLTDPAVVKALEGAAARAKAINEFTRQKLQEALQYGADNGWSIDHLVRGDAELGKPGLRGLIEQTYKGRAQNIARTEIGNAQNTAAGQRYGNFGIDRVLVMDNGVDDSAPGCIVLGNGGQGTIMPLSWAQSHPIGHPRCLRAFGAAFPDDGPIDTDAHAAWEAAGGDSPAIGGAK